MSRSADLGPRSWCTHGAQDLAIDPDVARWYSAALPLGELTVIDGAGHAANLTHADAVNSMLEAFLANV